MFNTIMEIEGKKNDFLQGFFCSLPIKKVSKKKSGYF